ncbi:ammonium transporter [Polaromonas sp. A23]|uniref:ammonium transporter n=1 Tax=Polaromonas sp. A23 TaxID=1944133 RepID=UPI0009871432|nr:ammonium transporter [Polaromonas sp. A23]OOG42827.1 ammonia channel protein [Polaromonas sp. A23]
MICLSKRLVSGLRLPAAAVALLSFTYVQAQSTVAATPAAAPVSFSSGDTAWMLVCTVLVLLMTVPGIMLFYSGMMRAKNALSIVAHVFAATTVVTLTWVAIGYSLAFTPGTPLLGDLTRLFSQGLIGAKVGAHPSAPTVPESAFFLFQLAFAVITFALIIGATVERMRLSATIFFAGFWTVLVYAPVAHWIWQPSGWLAAMGHMDYAGGTVVHIAAGASGLVAAKFVGPRRGFGKEPMVPHNLMITIIGAGLLWAGWFGFNAGSAFEASSRAVGALLATQVAASVGAFAWGLAEFTQRGKFSVLGMATGAIAGLVAVTPASGFVGPQGAAVIGAVSGVLCFIAVTQFKRLTGIDDSLDVFALHGVGGFIGTVLTPVFALKEIAPVTATILTNLTGALAVTFYAGAMTFIILLVVKPLAGLRVTAEEEALGLDLAQHGEMISGA